jgi:exopolyphosphatase/guanosine-5'-triphosphate,3'-diphosphate pyrophosphatase
VQKKTGVELNVLSGEDEARLTFLAVRRWYGWSAGALLCLDIGGGSLELSAGTDEDPERAYSVPLGAGRLTTRWFKSDPPSKAELQKLRDHVDAVLADPVADLVAAGPYDRVVATSKTFRTLARLAGAAPSAEGPRVTRILTRTGLTQVTAFISRITSGDLAELDGVSAGRAHQVLAGAVVAAAAMDALKVDQLELCPWALREGVILRRLDWIEGT